VVHRAPFTRIDPAAQTSVVCWHFDHQPAGGLDLLWLRPQV